MKTLSWPLVETLGFGVLAGYGVYGVLRFGEDFYQHLSGRPLGGPGYPYPRWLQSFFQFIFAPFPDQIAFGIYTTVAVVALFLAYRLSAPSPGWLLLLCIWSPSFITLAHGQLTPFLLLGLMLARKTNGWKSGIYSSLLWLKPYLAIGIALSYLSRRDWSGFVVYVLVGTIVVLTSLLGPGAAGAGPSYWTQWFLAHPYSVSLSGFFSSAPVQVVLSASAMGLALFLAWRKRLAWHLGLFLNFAFVPYLLGYDLPLSSPLVGSLPSAVAILVSGAGLWLGPGW